jgi:hypothetical protein
MNSKQKYHVKQSLATMPAALRQMSATLLPLGHREETAAVQQRIPLIRR